MKDYDESGGIGDISSSEVSRLSVTSAKTNDSFEKPASDRQCCVEILAYSEVARVQNPSIKFVILIKGCKTKFQLYVYFPKIDLLIRTTAITLTDTNEKPNIMGMFAFFLSINLQINTLFPNAIGYTEQIKCGWKRAYNKSGYNYFPFLFHKKFQKAL